MIINCLFAENRFGKYIFQSDFDRIGFVHLNDLLFYLDERFGKGTYRLKFNYIEEESP
jgi:hypothetical protein